MPANANAPHWVPSNRLIPDLHVEPYVREDSFVVAEVATKQAGVATGEAAAPPAQDEALGLFTAGTRVVSLVALACVGLEVGVLGTVLGPQPTKPHKLKVRWDDGAGVTTMYPDEVFELPVVAMVLRHAEGRASQRRSVE
jgi:hypothetical protein